MVAVGEREERGKVFSCASKAFRDWALGGTGYQSVDQAEALTCHLLDI